MKCDEKETTTRRQELFTPSSPLVIICEGFQDSAFVCAMLRYLKIENCDVLYPKKRRGGANGKSGIPAMVQLVIPEQSVKGIALLWDADDDPATAFKEACDSFDTPFHAPKQPFSIEDHKEKITGVFLMPGNGRNGTLEHLLLPAVYKDHPDLEKCVNGFFQCYTRGQNWPENKKAKRDMHCVIAAYCEDDPGSSLGFIWSKKDDNPIDIASNEFDELADFLRAFSVSIATATAAPAAAP